MRSADGGTPERTTDRTTDRTTGAARERVFCWEWDLAATPAQLWPLVADTNRFDRDSGVPAMTDVAEIGTAGDGSELRNGRTQIRLRQFGVPLTYVQDPFEWDEPHRFSVVRRFASGPIDTLRVSVRSTVPSVLTDTVEPLSSVVTARVGTWRTSVCWAVTMSAVTDEPT